MPCMALLYRIDGQYVDHVVIDAPYSVNQDLLDKLPYLSHVIHGSTSYDQDLNNADPYQVFN